MRKKETAIIGQLSFDSYQLSFPETTDFMSVVYQSQPTDPKNLWRAQRAGQREKTAR
jgi:hypothetical protein